MRQLGITKVKGFDDVFFIVVNGRFAGGLFERMVNDRFGNRLAVDRFCQRVIGSLFQNIFFVKIAQRFIQSVFKDFGSIDFTLNGGFESLDPLTFHT